MHHPYIAEILLSSCRSDVEPALCKKVLAPEVALLSGFGTLLSLMGIPIFTPAHWLWFFSRSRTCRSFLVWSLSLTSVIAFWGEDYGHGWSPGFDASRSSYIHTHWVTAASLMLLVVFIIYAVIEQKQNQSLVLLSTCRALCVLSGMIFWGMVATPALALGSLWCHSYLVGRSQVAMLQLLRHSLHSRVCLEEPKLKKNYPQETISKTDGPIRQKNKTGIKGGRTRKKYSRRGIA